jgi:hypothetical protein
VGATSLSYGRLLRVPSETLTIGNPPPAHFRYTKQEAEHYADGMRLYFRSWTLQVSEIGALDAATSERWLRTKAGIIEAGERLQAEKPDRVH